MNLILKDFDVVRMDEGIARHYSCGEPFHLRLITELFLEVRGKCGRIIGDIPFKDHFIDLIQQDLIAFLCAAHQIQSLFFSGVVHDGVVGVFDAVVAVDDAGFVLGVYDPAVFP